MTTGIYWGELACQPEPFELLATVGLEPAVATVRANRSQVLSWALKHDPKRFEGLARGGEGILLPKVAAQLRQAAPKKFDPLPSLPVRAHLVVEAPGYPGVRFADMFLVEARVADPDGRDERKDDLELVLADPRRFWRDYGLLRRDYNVPRGSAADGTLLYEQNTLRGGLRPHTAREIVQDCLDALPGGGRVVRFPAGEFPVQTVFGRGAAPIDVLRDVLDRLSMVFVRNLDGSASIYRAGEAVQVGETRMSLGGSVGLTHDPATGRGAWEGQIPDEFNSYDKRLAVDVPDEVAVVCPPPVYTVQVDYLEPWLRLERPDPTGGPPAVTSLEVTPDVLQKLGLTPRADIQPSDVAALARALANPGQGGAPAAFEAIAAGPTSGLEPWRVQKIPVLGGEFPEGFGAIPPDLIGPLQGELFRRWRLPLHLEHLLPFLDRAERRGGVRLRPMVEAWGFKATQITVDRFEAEEAEIAPDERTGAEVELQDVESRLAKARERIQAIELTPNSFVRAWQQILDKLPAVRVLGDEFIRPRRLPTFADFVAVGVTFPEAVKLVAQIAQQLSRFQSEFLGLDADALDPEGVTLEALKRTEQALARRRLQLLATVDPDKAIREQIETLRTTYEKKLASVGHDEAIFQEIAKLQEELGRAQKEPRRRKKTKRKVVLTRHQNLPRRPVPYRIEGREIVLDEPSVWLSNQDVADPRETYVIPMPPRITFGTWNLPPANNVQFPSLPAGSVSRNAFVNAAVKMLSERGLARLQVDLGDVLRREVSDGPAVFTFSRADRRSGQAAVGQHPLRVSAVEDPAVLVLHELPTEGAPEGANNREQAIARAAEIAGAYLSEPVREAGSLRVIGPRPVNCSSRVSGVRWATTGPDGEVDTTVSFDSESEPFPGVVRDLPSRAQGPIVAGFDPRSPENAA